MLTNSSDSNVAAEAIAAGVPRVFTGPHAEAVEYLKSALQTDGGA